MTIAADAHATRLSDDFGAFLLAGDMIERAVLDRARRAAASTGERLDVVLTRLGLVSETDLAAALSKYLSMPVALAAQVPPEPLLADLIEPDFVRRNRVMPLAVEAERLTVGVTDPFNDEPIARRRLPDQSQRHAEIFVPAEFDKAFDALYVGAARNGATIAIAGGTDASDIDVQRLRDMASEAPIIRLVNQIIAAAVEARASDIHIEPDVDARAGALPHRRPAAHGADAAARPARRRHLAHQDHGQARHRRAAAAAGRPHQDRGARRRHRLAHLDHADRVRRKRRDAHPRPLPRASSTSPSSASSGAWIAAFDKLMDEPNGIILVTGPTGSGKTTTLYTALKSLNSTRAQDLHRRGPDRVSARRHQPGAGPAGDRADFPHALRSILRQDPDIIMIGEIRDLETARIAIQASLTGHLVLSTLHTNSAAATITRLIDMGVENYLLASTVKGVVAQRLVRKLCPHCARPP